MNRYPRHLLRGLVLVGMLVGIWSSSAVGQSHTGASKQLVLHVKGLSCPFCAYGLEKKLKQAHGIKQVKVFMDEGKVLLTLDTPVAPDSLDALSTRLTQIVKDAGFTLEKVEQAQEHERIHTKRSGKEGRD